MVHLVQEGGLAREYQSQIFASKSGSGFEEKNLSVWKAGQKVGDVCQLTSYEIRFAWLLMNLSGFVQYGFRSCCVGNVLDSEIGDLICKASGWL